MLQNITLLLNDPAIIQGLLDGSLTRYGSVIRWASGTENAGQIVKHLSESSGLINQVINVSFSPISTVINLAAQGLNYYKLMGIEKILISAMGLNQIAAGASVLNVGVSMAGFAYTAYKLGEVQKKLGCLQQSVNAGFKQTEIHLNRIENQLEKGFSSLSIALEGIDNRLDKISNQLGYVYLLVADSREKQESLGKAISHLYQAMLIQEIANLKAELDDRIRFPNESPREAIKAASRARIFLGNEAMKVTPELDAELMLNSDISLQGWAVATATEANLLLEIGRHQEAKQLLAEEVIKYQQVAERWADKLISNNYPYLSTSYRFGASIFHNYITPQRVDRITNISKSDRILTADQIRWKKTEIEAEFKMSYSQTRYDQTWQYQQIAIAEYLDTMSELLARLDSLQYFADLCQNSGVKSSKELLPDDDAKPGLYLLDAFPM